jgi:hypothetical protein
VAAYDERAQHVRVERDLAAYFAELIAAKRTGQGDDLLSALAVAFHVGDRFGHVERVADPAYCHSIGNPGCEGFHLVNLSPGEPAHHIGGIRAVQGPARRTHDPDPVLPVSHHGGPVPAAHGVGASLARKRTVRPRNDRFALISRITVGRAAITSSAAILSASKLSLPPSQ